MTLLPRDTSTNQFAYLGLNDPADAQDALMSGVRRVVAETVTTSAGGIATVVNKPIIDITRDRRLDVATLRERVVNASDVSAVRTAGGAAIFVGTVTPTQAAAGQVPIFSDGALTVPLANTQVNVTYSYPVYVTVDASGNLAATLAGALDVSDRAARLLGVADVSDRAARQLGIIASISGALPAGGNNIGDVDVLTLPALPAGTNNIGDIDVLTLPATPAGANVIGNVRTELQRSLFYDDSASIGTPAGNATINGASRDALGAAAGAPVVQEARPVIEAVARGTQPFTLGIDFSRDLVTFRPWRRVASTALVAGDHVAEITGATLKSRAWRVMVLNGATIQGAAMDVVSAQHPA